MMQPLTITSRPAHFPFEELTEIESTIEAAKTMLLRLQGRRDHLTEELDRLTRPNQASPMFDSPAPRTRRPGYEYRGTFTGRGLFVDIYVDVLRRLFVEFPDRREAMAKALGSLGIQRSYVAKDPIKLFVGKSRDWSQRYSRPLLDGWYVDTNLNLERMNTLLPAAVQAAGLRWAVDVKVYWRHGTD